MKNFNHLQPGLYPGLTLKIYRSYGRFGGSDAAYLATHSPANWLEHRKKPATPAQKFGTAAHVLILEGPEVFEQRYIAHPGFDLHTNAGKSAHLEFLAVHAEREIITPLEYNTLIEMQNAVQESMDASEIIESCAQRELSLFWSCPRSTVQCCGRLDFFGNSIVGDLKTTVDASQEAFYGSILRYGYHIQGAHYMDGIDSLGCNDPIRFLFIAVKKAPPYSVSVYELDGDLLRKGRRLAMTARQKYRDAEEYGYWKGKDATMKLSKNGETINLEL